MNQKDQAGNRVVVVGICGSIRRGKLYPHGGTDCLARRPRVGAQTGLIDLKDYHLIFCDGKEDESTLTEDVFKLRREVSQAGGIILGTPEYHGSFSGVFEERPALWDSMKSKAR